MMDTDRLIRYLDSASAANDWLPQLGVEDLSRAHGNLVRMAQAGMTLDLLANVCEQLALHLPKTSDPDMALNNLERFVVASRSPLSLGSLIERDPATLPVLLQIFSSSQYLADQLICDPESFDLLRVTDGQPVSRDVLVAEICAEVDAAGSNDRAVMTVLRRYKHRESLRIAYGDFVRNHRLETVTEQISFLADALCEAALRFARRKLEDTRGTPRRPDRQPARFVVLALGKLGGVELNYSSDIDLVFLSDGEGKTDGERSISNAEFFDRLQRDFIKLLTEPTELGAAYRIDIRLRPDGKQGAAVQTLQGALHYYDVSGRTWERQAYVKARPIAGDLGLGHEFLDQMQSWIYRRYLSRADISGIKALKRRIEQRTRSEGGDERNVKTGHGGIRDVEFVIQFLQLLNGAELAEIRTGNTLRAMIQLEQAGCLTLQEQSILERNYTFLRKVEHRLQIMFDLQTHTLPSDERELGRLALRMGYAKNGAKTALDAFRYDLKEKTNENRKILDFLLHDAFGDDPAAEPETDLVLDPAPTSAAITTVLGNYGFRDVQDAYRNLMALATEPIPFLSTRRCRHFLASIAPRLLQSIAGTPDPDSTLVNLSKVSDSLGGKGVLWELFSFNPPTLQLYVRMCASSPYLSGILTSNPGMIDELLDSLLLDKLPTLESLRETLAELCRGAEDTEPILHSFKSSHHLRVGVRDILGKEDVQSTHRALSDIAEVCLRQIAEQEYQRLAEKFGEPTIVGGPQDGKVCELVILAMGKLGGCEPNYHSDLDVVFLYEADGYTQPTNRARRDSSTTNQHFFSQLGQRIIKVVTQLGPYGRLYELDPRLRPTGKSGSLAVSIAEFARYFAEGDGQLWERQALCKARPVSGSYDAQFEAMRVVRRAITEPGWRPNDAEEIRKMRTRMEDTASKRNLKRGPGGTVDIEFAVQLLQLRHAATSPSVLQSGTLDAVQALRQAGHLSADDARYLSDSYRFLRRIEAGLRLMNTTARHDLPEDDVELRKLAFLLRFDEPQTLLAGCQDFTAENRVRFNQLVETCV